jgi:hypothetical protein
MPIAQIIAAAIAESRNQKSDKEQSDILRDTLERIRGISLPELQRLQAEEVGRPEAAEADPEALAAQRAALGRLGRWGEGGVTPEDRAQLALAQGETARQGQIQQNALKQSMQARGVGGSGVELALRQQAGQSANENAYKAAIQNMLANRQRAYQATAAQGQLGSGMQGEAFRRKQAADTAKQYNAGARQRANQYNVGLPQHQFENQLNRERAAVAPGANLVGQLGSAAQGEAAFMNNVGAGVQKGIDSRQSSNEPNQAGLDELANNPYPDDEWSKFGGS